MSQHDEHDPLAGTDSAPSVSFKDDEPGVVKRLVADGPAEAVQQTVFGTEGVKAFWTNKDGSQGKPKMAAVITGTDDDGERRSLWAPIPSDLQSKLSEAQKRDLPGRRIDAGDVVIVKLTGREPSGKGNPKNVFAVKITPAKPAPQADPFDDSSELPPF